MNLPFYISRRYLVSKKSRNIVNVISLISIVVLTFISGAMVVILSAFNGIESLVNELFNTFDADITVTARVGKTFDKSALEATGMVQAPEVVQYSAYIEEDVMLKYRERPTVATIKGVDSTYRQISTIDSMIRPGGGDMELWGTDLSYCVMGLGVKSELDIPWTGIDYPVLQVLAPIRGKKIKKYKERAFNQLPIMLRGIYSVNAELDTKYILAPISFTRQLFNYEKEVTGYEIKLKPEVDAEEFKQRWLAATGDSYTIATRYDKNILIYSTSESEKWIAFLILFFVLIIAAFNIMASLTIVILEKKRDIGVFMSMGATERTVRQIFFLEGLLINFIGAVTGIGLGLLFSYLQETFHLVPLEGSIIDYYPMKIMWQDVLGSFLTVMAVGIVSSYFVVRYLVRKFA